MSTAESRPGAYHVATRAPGSYPQWARHQTQTTGVTSSLPSRPGLLDAQCEAVQSTAPNESVSSIGTRRHTLQPDIGFAVVGEGGSARILPYDAVMLSSRRLMENTQSTHSLLGESRMAAWNCSLCSYENVDGTSTTCSVCGSVRSNREELSNPASRATVRVPSVHQVGVVLEEPPLEPPPVTTIGQEARSRRSSDNLRELGIETDMPTPRRRSNRPSRHSLRKSTSFKQMLGTSFANWSKNEKGPWTCPSCTYLNQEALHLTCEVCGRTRSEKVENPASDSDSNRSLTDYLNSSLGSGQIRFLEEQERAVQDVQEGVIERERMYELMEEQSRILSEMQAENNVQTGQAINQVTREDLSAHDNTKRQIEDTRRQLKDLREELETALETERKQLELVENVQRQRRAEIERDEGCSLDLPRLQDTPGAKKQSPAVERPPAVLDWLAQERMLDDWKTQRTAREEQLEDVRRQEERVFRMYEGMAQGA